MMLPTRYRPRHRRERPARRRLSVVVGAAMATIYVAMPAQAQTKDVVDAAEAGLAATNLSDLATADLTDFAAAVGDRESRISRSGRPATVEPSIVLQDKPSTAVAPVDSYRITSEFGDVSSLWSSGSHSGLDFAAPSGTPLRAVKDAVVKRTGWDGAYGQQTVLELPSGAQLWYAHQDSVSVSQGDKVRAGQVIGTVGSTGNVTGPHLHLEYRPSPKRPADPAAALAKWDIPRF